MGRKRTIDKTDGENGTREDSLRPVSKRKVSDKRVTDEQNAEEAYLAGLVHDDEDADEDGDEALVQRRDNFEAGQIRKIHVENFMCHKSLTIQLHPGLNFIIGKNGSGKSAIAAAIQLCLGASAKNTGRGSQLASLVREGSTVPALVQVTLLNEGPDAFQPNLYGNRIIVERKIARGSGISGYSLKSEKGEEISTSKSELEKMLRAFNIHVDNPCCVLTQDESKKFINGKENDKYDFFLKATGLHSLREELREIKHNFDQTQDSLKIHEKSLHDKKQKVRELKEKFERLQRLALLQDNINLVSAKLTWRKVLDVEEKLQVEVDNLSEALQLRSQLEEELSRKSSCTDSFDDDIAAISAESNQALTQKSAVEEDINMKKALHRKNTLQVESMKTRIVDMQRELAANNNRKKLLEREISDLREKAKASANNEEKHLLDEIEAISRRMTTLREEEEGTRREKNSFVELLGQYERELNDAARDEKRHQVDIDRCNRDLQSLTTGTNRAAIFGSEWAELATEVAASLDEFQGPVLGPIGCLVTVNEEYRSLSAQLERALGPMLRAFLVTNGEDREKLLAIAHRKKVRGFIVQTQPMSARYSIQSLNADPAIVLAMDALVIPNDLVFNCLVDQVNIDRTAVISTDVMKQLLLEGSAGRQSFRYGINAVVDENCSLIKYVNGNKSDEANRFPIRNILTNDPTMAIRTAERLMAEATEAQALARQRKVEFSQKRIQEEQAIRACDGRLHSLRKEMDTAQRRKRALEDELREQRDANNIDTTMLEDELRDLEHVIDTMHTDIEMANSELNNAKAALQQSARDKAEAERQLNGFVEILKEFEGRLLQIANRKRSIEKQVTEQQRALNAQSEQVKKLEGKVEALQREVEEESAKARQETDKLLGDKWNGERLELSNQDSRAHLERERRQFVAELEVGRQDPSLRENINSVRDRYESARSECEAAEALVATVQHHLMMLKEDEETRRKKWKASLRTSVKLTKSKFDDYVQKKGSSGTIDFNHDEQAMMVTYQVDNADQSTIRNDVRNLSGGERSFVTFSLLLALGHVIESPFRLMDEYDVFMDEPTRKLTLETLVHYAKETDQRERQFIILTPHKLGDLRSGRYLRIIKMPEPVRNSAHGLQQQTL